MLYRKIESFIRDHLESKNNKILLIEGASKSERLILSEKCQRNYLRTI